MAAHNTAGFAEARGAINFSAAWQKIIAHIVHHLSQRTDLTEILRSL